MAKTVLVNGKEWTKDSVRTLLQTNDKAVLKAIKLIYSFQTEDEKCFECTNTNNGQGFSKIDADIMSSFARALNQGRPLSEKQMIVARKRIVKYSNQIFNYMKSKKADM